MFSTNLHRRLLAHFLLLCVCVAAVNTCPKRKLIATDGQVQLKTSQYAIDQDKESILSVCTEGIENNSFYRAIKTDGNGPFPDNGFSAYSLNLLHVAQGTSFYHPPTPRSRLHAHPLPLFLKNGVLIV